MQLLFENVTTTIDKYVFVRYNTGRRKIKRIGAQDEEIDMYYNDSCDSANDEWLW